MISDLTLPGNSALMEAVAASGMSGVQNAVAGATTVTGKRRLEERSAFDKRLRFSVRQTESAYRYRDIVVKKQDGFTHILLSTKSSENNTLNPEVRPNLNSLLSWLLTCRVMLFLDPFVRWWRRSRAPWRRQLQMTVRWCYSALLAVSSVVASTSCILLDAWLTTGRRKASRWPKPSGIANRRSKIVVESCLMSPGQSALTCDLCLSALRTFVNTFIQFRKPIVAAVNGPALGLGAAILPLCDVVWANEKAWFQTPYTSYGQTPDACSSFTFPRIMGLASVRPQLFCFVLRQVRLFGSSVC